jgi:hypothetical protein
MEVNNKRGLAVPLVLAVLSAAVAMALVTGCREPLRRPPKNAYIPAYPLPKVIPVDAAVYIPEVQIATGAGKLHFTSGEVFPENIREAIRKVFDDARLFREVSLKRMVVKPKAAEEVVEAPPAEGDIRAKTETEILDDKVPADYELSATVGMLDASGYKSTVARVLIRYALKKTSTGRVVWQKNYLTKYGISAREIRWDVQREEDAYNGAVRDNIFRMAKDLSEFVTN